MSPVPPFDMRSPQTAYTVFYVLFLAQFAGSAVWLVWHARRTRSAVPLAALGGAAVIGYLVPPVYNHLTLVWFPSNIPHPYIEAFSMKDPFFDWMGNTLFFGFGGYVAMRVIASGAGARGVCLVALAWGVADLLYELPFLAAHMYRYYGDQPFLVGGFPLHWVVLNSSVPVLVGVIMYELTTRARTPRERLLGAAAAPVAAGACLFIPILPVALTLHGDFPSAARYAAAVLTMAIALATIVAIARRAREVRPVAAGPGRSPAGRGP